MNIFIVKKKFYLTLSFCPFSYRTLTLALCYTHMLELLPATACMMVKAALFEGEPLGDEWARGSGGAASDCDAWLFSLLSVSSLCELCSNSSWCCWC